MPILERFEQTKTVFVKTDCMAWIILQPDDDKESNKATKNIIETGVCNFYLENNGARVHPGFYE